MSCSVTIIFIGQKKGLIVQFEDAVLARKFIYYMAAHWLVSRLQSSLHNDLDHNYFANKAYYLCLKTPHVWNFHNSAYIIMVCIYGTHIRKRHRFFKSVYVDTIVLFEPIILTISLVHLFLPCSTIDSAWCLYIMCSAKHSIIVEIVLQ